MRRLVESLSLSLSVGIAINRFVDPRHGLWINVASGYFFLLFRKEPLFEGKGIGHEGGFSFLLLSIEYLFELLRGSFFFFYFKNMVSFSTGIRNYLVGKLFN